MSLKPVLSFLRGWHAESTGRDEILKSLSIEICAQVRVKKGLRATKHFVRIFNVVQR